MSNVNYQVCGEEELYDQYLEQEQERQTQSQAEDQYRASLLNVLRLRLDLNDKDVKAFSDIFSNRDLERVAVEALSS